MNLIELDDNSNRKSKGLIAPVRPVFKEMFKLRTQDNKKLLTEFDFDSDLKYIRSINVKLMHLFDGSFFRAYQLNNDNMDKERVALAKRKILSVRKDWEALSDLLLYSAENFSYWFDQSYEPLSKKWLAQYKNINSWLFNDFSSYSPFVLCSAGLPSKSTVSVSERVKTILPEGIQKLGEKVLGELFSNASREEISQFWISVNICLKREKEIANKSKDDPLFTVRFHNAGSFTEKFLADLPSLSEELEGKYVSVYTIKGFLWDTWLQKMCDEDYIGKDFATVKKMYSNIENT